jgi:electron transfer flavoprotein beta subunit
MNLLVCIKQVPASSKVDVDPKTGVLIRDGLNVKMNPYDLYALEAAFAIKENYESTTITAITMGPNSAKSVLEEALYMGCDEAVLLSDRRFAGADVLATAYTLSQLIKALGVPDLIICGKQTTDGDTAQVGPEIAEFLGIPHLAYVIETSNYNDKTIRLRNSYDTYDEINEVQLPCLITVDKGDWIPRLPSYKRKVNFKDYQIRTLTLKDLVDQDPKNYGLNGSPTQVEEIFPPDKSNTSINIEGSKEELAKKMFDILKKGKFI